MTKRPVQKQTHRKPQKTQRTPRRNRHLEKTILVCYSKLSVFIILLFIK